MKKLETFRTCGREFESNHGRKYCSESCRNEANKEQWKRGNARRYAGISGQTEKRVCALCGAEFDGIGVKKYCSPDCYHESVHRRNKDYFPEWYRRKKEKQHDKKRN